MARVLVVEDDPGIRQLVSFVLGDQGHTVEEASDGAEALAAVERLNPDIILLDMKMPVMDGWEFAARYRARRDRRATMVVFTAAKDAAARAAEIGAAAYVAKPFDVDVLVAQVAALAAAAPASPTGNR